MIGRTLSHFRISAKLGEGGMGVVYRAEDAKLGREVAIKVLPEAVAKDPERLARFEREARVLASLNHPNIGAIYSIESEADESFLVMELVEGEDLQKRLERDPLSWREAQPLAQQIASALEAAHERGIVHRDLKPANIKVTPGGRVKVLDFGLARAMETSTDAAVDLSRSPTLTAVTGTGILLGTAAYMSPEQARGQEIDKRTDIWAFGCVLYEMLCGQPTFEGDTVSDVLARILERQVDLDRLPDDTPSSVVRLLRRCLEKDPTKRLRDIGDARWDLAGEEERPAPAAATEAASRGSWPALIAVFAAGALVGALLWLVGGGSAAPPVAGSVSRFELQIPPSDPYSTLQNVTLALSPDGRALAYAAQPADQAEFSQIYLRHIDSFEPLAVPDTFGAYSPFFSPDGKWIGYFDRTGLWKKPVRGGPSVMLASVPGMGRGASWAEKGRIFYSPSWFSAIHEISADGGEGRAVTTLLENEKSHRFPSVTPDGKVLIFTVSRSDTDDFDDASVAIQSLETGERRTLVDGASCGRFLARDRLLYGRAGRLYVAPLDLDGLELAGPPRPVVDDLLTSPTFGSAQFAVSSNGTLAYLVGSPELFSSRVVEVSRSGEIADLPLAPRPFTMVVPSADGKRMAMRIDGANGQVWIHDSERGTLSRITHLWDADFPSWQPGGESISYVLSRGESSALARVASDGTGEPEILWEGRNLTYASWAPDGRSLVFTDHDPSTNGDLWILDLDGEPEVRSYLRTPADEVDAVISPDGNWLAYTSDASGRAEVYVQGYPVPGRRWQISAQGGLNAIWSVADDELLFKNGDEILAVPVELGEAFSAGIPHHLFEFPNVARGDDTRSFAVSRDGRYFAILPPADWQPTGKLRLVLDWASTLE